MYFPRNCAMVPSSAPWHKSRTMGVANLTFLIMVPEGGNMRKYFSRARLMFGLLTSGTTSGSVEVEQMLLRQKTMFSTVFLACSTSFSKALVSASLMVSDGEVKMASKSCTIFSRFRLFSTTCLRYKCWRGSKSGLGTSLRELWERLAMSTLLTCAAGALPSLGTCRPMS